MVDLPIPLSEKSPPTILSDAQVKQYATVTRDAIILDITNSSRIHRTIYYEETARFGNWTDGSVHECDDKPFVLPLSEWNWGSEFKFRVLSKDENTNMIVEYFQFTVMAELNKEEMQAFLNNILRRIDQDEAKTKMRPAYFYRNFTETDEQRILTTNYGYFEMFLKGNSGHRSSPLYRKLFNVTYFSCKLIKLRVPYMQQPFLQLGSMHPDFSPFGDQRFSCKPSALLNDDSVLFLAGMHCYDPYKPEVVNWAHYVTVVVCQRGSLSFRTCNALGLIQLPWHDNPILRWDKNADQIYAADSLVHEEGQDPTRWPHGVWVEVLLCDQPIHLCQGYRTSCSYKGYQSEHKSSASCRSCHGYLNPRPTAPDTSLLKRRSLEENCATPEKTTKEN